jgi:hypothetical protein
MTVAKKPGHRGEHDISRKTIARGMLGVSGVTVVTMLVCFYFYTRGCGRIVRPAFPAPSDSRGERFLHNSGASRRENAVVYLGVIARSEATKQSTLASLLPYGLLRSRSQ